jgi:hypothetical protein
VRSQLLDNILSWVVIALAALSVGDGLLSSIRSVTGK